MKNIVLAILLVFSALAWAAGDPNPAEYAVNVHVSSSSISGAGLQELSVVIGGKNYNLECEVGTDRMLLALGDYKAKLVKDEHKTAYDSFQIYEFLLPDNKTRKFQVVGRSE